MKREVSPETSPCSIKSKKSDSYEYSNISKEVNDFYEGKDNKNRYSPLVKTIAKLYGLKSSDLDHLYGTSKGGKLNKNDIVNYIKHLTKYNQDKINTKKDLDLKIEEGDKKITLDRIRKITSEKMTISNQSIPHVTSFIEADMTKISKLRDEIKEDFKKKYGAPLTFTPFFLWAIIQSLKDFPIINSYYSNEVLLQKKAINLGIAVSVGENNLLVPVIKNANNFSIIELAQKLYEISIKARNKQLSSDDIIDATYSISNIGVYNTLIATPMINPPQVAVMAIGTIKKTLELNEVTKEIENRSKVFLCHSYDHRIIDGALGSSFANKVREYLEKFNKLDY